MVTYVNIISFVLFLSLFSLHYYAHNFPFTSYCPLGWFYVFFFVPLRQVRRMMSFQFPVSLVCAICTLMCNYRIKAVKQIFDTIAIAKMAKKRRRNYRFNLLFTRFIYIVVPHSSFGDDLWSWEPNRMSAGLRKILIKLRLMA